MSLGKTAYYGLLICLVALLALGLQPLRFGKASVAQRNTKEAPVEESGDEEPEPKSESESESETESKIDSPIRRRSLTVLLATDQVSELAETISPFKLSRTRISTLLLRDEQSARNGIGGPLRL